MLQNRNLEGGDGSWKPRAVVWDALGRLGASSERLRHCLGRLGAVLERFERLGSVLGYGAFTAVLGRLGTFSSTRCSHQTEALRLGCHLVLNLYSLLLRCL